MNKQEKCFKKLHFNAQNIALSKPSVWHSLYSYLTHCKRLFPLWLTSLFLLFPNQASSNTDTPSKELPVCAYIASYAPGYSWQDGIERGLKKSLQNHCQVKTFFMNSKKVFSEEKLLEIGEQATQFIDKTKPDIVIVSDDNAVKYVLAKHYHDSKLPFVYCGVNNTGTSYGLPYPNTTGMVEKNPTEMLLRLLFNINPAKTHVAFMTTKGTSAAKDIAGFHKVVEKFNIQSSAYSIRNEEDWRKIYKQLQEDPKVDIILFSNKVAFKTWDHQDNLDWIKQHNNKISIATQISMMPYVALGMNKSPDEQGVWAGLAAIEVLNGTPVNQIAVVPNSDFQLWVNPVIAKPFRDKLPEHIFSQSLVFHEGGSR